MDFFISIICYINAYLSSQPNLFMFYYICSAIALRLYWSENGVKMDCSIFRSGKMGKWDFSGKSVRLRNSDEFQPPLTTVFGAKSSDQAHAKMSVKEHLWNLHFAEYGRLMSSYMNGWTSCAWFNSIVWLFRSGTSNLNLSETFLKTRHSLNNLVIT